MALPGLVRSMEPEGADWDLRLEVAALMGWQEPRALAGIPHAVPHTWTVAPWNYAAIPPYEADAGTAWDVVLWMKGRGFCFGLVTLGFRDGFSARFEWQIKPDQWDDVEEAGETGPLAICRAAVAASKRRAEQGVD